MDDKIKETIKRSLKELDDLDDKLESWVDDLPDDTEARDKLDASKDVVDNYLESATEQSKTLMGEIELKSKLAKMEAEDFWEERGPAIKAEFQQSSESMVKLAQSTADEIQNQLSRWNSLLKSQK